jgi:preprotein translocase subunit SecB
VDEAEIEPVLLVEAPRYLFPYARRIVSDMTSEGGFPPFLLEPLDFATIYAQRKAAAAQQPIGQA